jgi:predicted negative regulator of RcsB-dependent stress response
MPVILIEVILVFGGVLAFGWWQLRSVARDRKAAAAAAAAASAADSTAAAALAPGEADKSHATDGTRLP